jgi:hypothetical protein
MAYIVPIQDRFPESAKGRNGVFSLACVAVMIWDRTFWTNEPSTQIVIGLESSRGAPARAQLSIDDARRVRDALTQQIENAEKS